MDDSYEFGYRSAGKSMKDVYEKALKENEDELKRDDFGDIYKIFSDDDHLDQNVTRNPKPLTSGPGLRPYDFSLTPIPYDLGDGPRLTPEEIERIRKHFGGGNSSDPDNKDTPSPYGRLLDDLIKSYDDLAKDDDSNNAPVPPSVGPDDFDKKVDDLTKNYNDKIKELKDQFERYNKTADDNDYVSGVPKTRGGGFDKKEDRDDVSAGQKKIKRRVKKTPRNGLTPKRAPKGPSKPPTDPSSDESPLEEMMKKRVADGEVEEFVDEFGMKRYRKRKE